MLKGYAARNRGGVEAEGTVLTAPAGAVNEKMMAKEVLVGLLMQNLMMCNMLEVFYQWQGLRILIQQEVNFLFVYQLLLI